MNIKKEYIAPALRVVCFKVEMGSAASDPTPTSTLMFWQDEVDDHHVEDYESTNLTWL